MIFLNSAFEERTPFVLENNLALSAVASASASAAAFPPSAVTAENTWQAWTCGANSGWIELDLGAALSFDTLALVGHNLAALGASCTFAHKLLVGDALTSLTAITPPDGRPAVLVLSAPVTARYVRCTIPAGPTAPPSIAALVVGTRRKLPAWVEPGYIRAPDAEAVEGEAAISRGGNYLGATVRRKGGRLAPQLSPIGRAWWDTNMAAFRAHYAARRPFLWASSPGDYPEDVAYAWRGDGAAELRAALVGGGAYVRASMEMDFHVA
jgi:hypothetical protein